MERCDLTQVPCRKAIMEVVQNNKNRRSLQHTYELAELFQTACSGNKAFFVQHDCFIQGAMGVLIMDYRKEIAEMINRIRSEKILRYIYLFIADIYKDYGEH